MNQPRRIPNLQVVFLCLLLLAGAIGVPDALADTPMLAIRLMGGESAFYEVSEIGSITFSGDTTLVVVTGEGSDNYPTETVVRIEVLWDATGVIDFGGEAAPIDAFHLFQNQPNPFSPATRISFELPQAGEVELRIYSLDGRLVRTLLSDERQAGSHTVPWNRLNDSGRKVSSGVYFYSLTAPGVKASRQMILLP